MPLREYRCPNGHTTDELIDGDYPKKIICGGCGLPAVYRIGRVSFSIDFRAGFDAGAGSNFNTARQRDTFLDKNNLEKAPDGAYEAEYKG